MVPLSKDNTIKCQMAILCRRIITAKGWKQPTEDKTTTLIILSGSCKQTCKTQYKSFCCFKTMQLYIHATTTQFPNDGRHIWRFCTGKQRLNSQQKSHATILSRNRFEKGKYIMLESGKKKKTNKETNTQKQHLDKLFLCSPNILCGL